jgi:hypothetical protein
MEKIAFPVYFMGIEPAVLPLGIRGKTNKKSFVPEIENKALPMRRLGKEE